MARPVKLYNHAVAPNPRRVRIFAAEKGIELSLEEVDILAGQSRTPEFLAKNSSGEVPVLELDDGSYLSESVAIRRIGAELAITGTVQKVSNLILNMNIYVRDASSGAAIAAMSAELRGNTDESWSRTLDWLVRNRLLAPGYGLQR